MQQYLRLVGRNVWVVNLDPANEGIQQRKQGQEDADADTADDNHQNATDDDRNDGRDNDNSEPSLPYQTIIDVCQEIVNLKSVMEQTGLGPNGGLMYCMEYIEKHLDEAIIEKIRQRAKEEPYQQADGSNIYLLLDLPGQVELYTHSTCVQTILQRLCKAFDLRLTAVQLIDAQYCTDVPKFLSAALLSTTTMLRLELPTVNVLSKVDLLSQYGELPMHFEYFTECTELDRLLPFLNEPSGVHGESIVNEDLDEDISYLDDVDYQKARQRRQQSKMNRKFEKLHAAMAEVVDDFGLLSFVPLNISDAESVGRVVARIDKANGYVFIHDAIHKSEGSTTNAADLFQCAVQSEDPSTRFEMIAGIQERLQLASTSSNKSKR